MVDFFTLINTTNQSIQAQYQVTNIVGGVDPTVLLILPSIILLIGYTLMWWFADSRMDIGITFFLLPLAGLMFGDPFLMSVKLTLGGNEITLPMILFLAGIYEMAIIFAMMSDVRKNNGKDSP
jgi:hypothetical protein